ncbi:copper resistance protein CopC [Phenylobacterium sp.]|uniref:copper resistance protein CopC n=1 Tax=Phenylobacterium sp. TaxID=1871053 RepID=UPI002DEEC8AB|nr:copper resistance protein CopC [Phenylobacterium sp.]
MRKTYLIAGVAIALWAGQASAHARLLHAAPRVGATVAQSPSELRLAFSESIDPAQSSVSLSGPHGLVALGRLRLDAADKRIAVATVPVRLAPGAYRVQWSVISLDTHHTEGDFRFKVAPD